MTTYVNVPVPEERLIDVYRVLGRPAGPVDPPRPRPTLAAGEDDEEAFDPDFWRDWVNIRRHLMPRSRTIRELAKYLAERPDEEVTADEAAEALGLPYGWNSLAGALGAFGRYCGNRDIAFPWETSYDNAEERARMRLDAETAEVFRKRL